MEKWRRRKCRKLLSNCSAQNFGKTSASHRIRTFKILSDGKLHCFGKQYWNQNKYFTLISIDFNTRMCFFLLLFSPLLRYSKTEGYRDFRSRARLQKFSSFLPSKKKLCLNPKSVNFDFETKVWDKMPTERETYYLCLSRSTYRTVGADETLPRSLKCD